MRIDTHMRIDKKVLARLLILDDFVTCFSECLLGRPHVDFNFVVS